jgi:transcriptional regulator of stress and heat shock response
MRLSDTIEEFIKMLLAQETKEVELKRNELAEYFHCAPSQINYVLSTRFTADHGYLIESQRGGGGYIRIVRVTRSQDDQLAYLMRERIGEQIDEQTAQVICTHLSDNGIIAKNDALLMISALSNQALSVPIPEAIKDTIRAKTLRNMLLGIARRQLLE